ncbi:hypothetical protein niasHS_010796 [Heterodera schachtii]|uniref:7-dehydrocholesterol reductase n=1 Tax=Heterodera schachtii TaxID=97005 RepID=A0ABD2ISL7_HETSC
MSFRLNRRRSSGTGSNLLSRRCSMSQRDFEQLAKRRQRLSDWLLLPLALFSPPLVLFLHSHLTVPFHRQTLFEHFLAQICSPVPPIVVILISQIQLFFLWFLPSKDVQVNTEEGESFSTRFTCFESSLLICLFYFLGVLLGFFPGNLIFAHWVGLMFWLSLLSLFVPLLLLLLPPRLSSSVSPPSPAGDDFSVSAALSVSSEALPPGSPAPSLISQLFYGVHLQPVLLNVDLKAFLTVRVSLSLWALFLISAQFVHHQFVLTLSVPTFSPSLLTTSALQFFYIFRRQWFEHLLIDGSDNKNDRAGFYRLFSVLVFLPTLYLVPISIGTLSTDVSQRPTIIYVGLFLIGLFFQCLNTAIDLQRHKFRSSNGDMKIGGKDPFYICTRFRKKSGESAVSLLLGSGYWAMARHPNYTAEWLSFLAWTLPWTRPMAFLPLAFLLALFWVRIKRDELRCFALYGQLWAQHCARVPFILFPGF